MRKIIILFAALMLAAAVPENARAGQSLFQFLRYNSSARGAGLAGCMVSMPEDPAAFYFNPASIYTVKEKPFSLTFLKHVLDINSGNASYIRKFEDLGVFAASVGFLSYGSFDRADNNGLITGSFGGNNLAFGVSYSNILDSNFYYGVTVKFIHTSIDDLSAAAIATDVGFLYRLPDGRTNFGVSVLHAGAQLSKYNGITERLPLDVRLGFNHRLMGLPLLFNMSLHHLADETDSFFEKFRNIAVGGELYLGDYIQLRLGYDNQVRNQTAAESSKGLSGFTGGLGIRHSAFQLDYGLVQYGSAATLHRFSVNFEL